MIEQVLVCDACGRRTLATPDAVTAWFHLRQEGHRAKDICPRCVARAFGWQGNNGQTSGRATVQHA